MLKLAIESWNVTSLMGKELELVQEVERYQLDIVGLTDAHFRFGTPEVKGDVKPKKETYRSWLCHGSLHNYYGQNF